MSKKIQKYFEKHIFFNSGVHLLIGAGIGVLVTYPMIGAHPVRWGILLLALGLLGHAYPLMVKK